MSANKSWTPTRYQGLYKHANGTYYVRVGNKTWRSLKTKIQAVALKKRDEVLQQAEREIEKPKGSITLNGPLFSDLMDVRRWQILHDTSIKVSTKNFWNERIQSLIKYWPGIENCDVRKMSREECEEWFALLYERKLSPSSINGMRSMLNALFEIAIEGGLIGINPIEHIKRAKPKHKDLLSDLPSRDEFKKMVKLVRSSRSRWNAASGDLVEFLAYSGCRIGEATQILWKHIDWHRGEIIVQGDPEEGTKNRRVRRVPIIGDMENLLKQIQANSPLTKPDDKVLLVKSAKVAMRKAADSLNIERITHHDLRHLFATTCIESGVDIPTVAKWLGHRDGGALAMRVYGHLRNEHSLAEAKKVSFD